MAQNFKILIVEDEEIIRFGLQDNFEMENYEVETACDGEEAIEKTDSFQPQLVLLDLMIPKKSGFEVCRYIRNKHPECYHHAHGKNRRSQQSCRPGNGRR